MPGAVLGTQEELKHSLSERVRSHGKTGKINLKFYLENRSLEGVFPKGKDAPLRGKIGRISIY